MDFQDGGCQPSLILNVVILLADGIRKAVPNFIKIYKSISEILRFFDFSRWQSSAILDLLEAYLDHPRRWDL